MLMEPQANLAARSTRLIVLVELSHRAHPSRRTTLFLWVHYLRQKIR